jgi:epoxyqueuosine reductase
LRNVAVALGNWGSPEAVPVLIAALSDAEPLVRAHAAWGTR